MKVIKYTLCTRVNRGSEREPDWLDVLTAVELDWSEANEEIAKREAADGLYTVEENGAVEDLNPTQEARIAELEEALALLLSEATE